MEEDCEKKNQGQRRLQVLHPGQSILGIVSYEPTPSFLAVNRFRASVALASNRARALVLTLTSVSLGCASATWPELEDQPVKTVAVGVVHDRP